MNFEYGDFVRNVYPLCEGRIFVELEGIDSVSANRENVDRYILLPSGMTESMRKEYMGPENQHITKDSKVFLPKK